MLRCSFRPARAAAAAVALFSAVLFLEPARAAESIGNVALGLSYYDFTARDDTALDFRLEYRHNQGILFAKPWVGIEATSDGGVWGGGGLYFDAPLDPVAPLLEHLILTGMFGVGGYSDGGGKKMGNTMEFRAVGELTYRLDGGMRVGVSFNHISNADTGVRNPGTNNIGAILVIPFGGSNMQ